MKRKLLSLFLCLSMIFSMMPVSVFAIEDEVPPSTSSLVEGDDQTEVFICICKSRCTEEAFNSECAVCSLSESACTAVAESSEPNELESECLCSGLCMADNINEACTMCSADYARCALAQEVKDTEEPVDTNTMPLSEAGVITAPEGTKISGTVGQPLPDNTQMEITLVGDTFVMATLENTPITDMFINIPGGITATASNVTETSATVTFSGTPTQAKSEIITAYVPASIGEVYFLTNGPAISISSGIGTWDIKESAGKNTLSFDARNGDTISDVAIGEGMTWPINPTWGDNEAKNNYTFVDWYTEPDGGGTRVDLTVAKEFDDSATVYAKWEKGSKTIRTEALDLTDSSNIPSAAIQTAQGWSWSSEDKILSMRDATINTVDTVAVKLPAWSTITVTGDNTVMSGEDIQKEIASSCGISVEGYLIINGTGTLNITAGKATCTEQGSSQAASIGVECKSLELKGAATLNTKGGEANGGIAAVSVGIRSPLGTCWVTLTSGTLNATGGKAWAVSTNSYGIAGELTAKGGTATMRGDTGATTDDFSATGATIKANTANAEGTGSYDPEVNVRDYKWIRISFGPSITITSQPADADVTVGAITGDLSVVATAPDGKTITYQWYQNTTNSTSGGTVIAGATEASYTIPTNLPVGTYYYYGILKADGCDDVTTNVITVTVKNPLGTLNGKVTKGSAAEVGATVKLMNGKTEVSKTNADANGAYSFSNIVYGMYNLVVTSSGKTISVPVQVNAPTVTKDVALPDVTGNQNTVVEVKDDKTPAITTDLNGLFTAQVVEDDKKGITLGDREKIQQGSTVEIKLTAEKKEEANTNGDAEKIKEKANDEKANYLFLDLSAFKQVDTETPVQLSELNALVDITIEVPENMRGSGLRMLRVHGSNAAEELTAGGNGDGERFVYTAGEAYATLTIKKFSTYAFVSPTAYTVVVNGSYAATTGAGNYAPGTRVTINAGTRSGYTFNGWVTSDGVTFTNANSATTTFTMPAKVVTVTANWRENGGGNGSGSSSATYYTITATAGSGGKINTGKTVSVRAGNSAEFTFTPNKGYQIADVFVNGKSVGAVKTYTFTNVQSNQTIRVTFKADSDYTNPQTSVELNTTDHFAYMAGYNNGTFGADNNITRAEVTAMFSRLLTKQMDVGKTYTSNFTDVKGNEWYANAVGYMAQLGIISGYADGTFGGNRPITRAEFAVIASRFDQLIVGAENSFTDVSNSYWAKDCIASAAEKGWVSGYSDGTFKPERNITRAEVVSIVNRMLNRNCDVHYVTEHGDAIKYFSDVTPNHWAYYQICEATNAHDYERGGSEIWIALD